jgi:hypothetical protein
MTAGRRRKARKTRKHRGGAMYGFGQTTPIAPGAASVTAVDNTQFYNSATGQPIAGGRRRKSRKSRKGGRKSRKMRGGASGVSMGTTYASFTGTGERGIANYEQGVVQGNKF